MEGGGSGSSSNNNRVCPDNFMMGSFGVGDHQHHMNSSSNKMFLPNLLNNYNCDGQMKAPPPPHVFVQQDTTENRSCNNICDSMRAKIMAHPQFPRLLAAYVNCQKVGAPPEVVARLEEACGFACGEGMNVRSSGSGSSSSTTDPSLDQFMEAYCEMLTKYEQELTKPFKEAMLFLSKIDSQLKALTLVPPFSGQNGSSEEEFDVNDHNYIDPHAEDGELKGQLLRKYSGHLGSLKQEFMKKKKKGKLPREARQQLLDWWSRHDKWPYPSESQKLALAQSTGLDQKQINNWFINQRKRHWKPSEDMQFVVMDAAAYPYYYMDHNVMGNPFPMDCAPTRF